MQARAEARYIKMSWVGASSSTAPSAATPVAAQSTKPVEWLRSSMASGGELHVRVREDHEAQLRDEPHIPADHDHGETDDPRTRATEDEPRERQERCDDGEPRQRLERQDGPRGECPPRILQGVPDQDIGGVRGGDEHRPHAETPQRSHVAPAFGESNRLIQASRGATSRSRAGAPTRRCRCRLRGGPSGGAGPTRQPAGDRPEEVPPSPDRRAGRAAGRPATVRSPSGTGRSRRPRTSPGRPPTSHRGARGGGPAPPRPRSPRARSWRGSPGRRGAGRASPTTTTRGAGRAPGHGT